MTEQKEKQQSKNNLSGYFLIALGVIGIVTRFIGGTNWSTIGIIKLFISLGILAYGQCIEEKRVMFQNIPY